MSSLAELTKVVADHEAAFAAALAEVDAASPAARAAALDGLRIGWTGRKSGRLAGLMEQLPTLPPADRRAFGQLVNALKSRIEQALTEREMSAAATRRPAGAVDVTLPGRPPVLGHRHPLSLVREEVQAIFTRLGYQVLEGPEIEDDWHNFEALNMPEEHPARDMQDTLYLEAPLPPSPAARRRRIGTPDEAPGRAAAADPAAHAHLGDADPLHGAARSAGAAGGDRPGLSPRQPRPHPHADVPPVRGAGGRARHHARRSEGHAAGDGRGALRRRHAGAVPSELLPVHRAERRSGHRLHPLRRRRLPGVQAHRLDRDPRQRDGAPRGLRGGRLRPRPR